MTFFRRKYPEINIFWLFKKNKIVNVMTADEKDVRSEQSLTKKKLPLLLYKYWELCGPKMSDYLLSVIVDFSGIYI